MSNVAWIQNITVMSSFTSPSLLLGMVNLCINMTSGKLQFRDSPLGCGGWCNAWRLCHGVSLHIPWPTPEVSICFTLVCSISAVREASRKGSCGGGRLLAGLVHFTVNMILWRDMGTHGWGRWLGTTTVFGWQGVSKHWGAKRWVHTGICGTDRARFSLLLRGLSNRVCIGTFNYIQLLARQWVGLGEVASGLCLLELWHPWALWAWHLLQPLHQSVSSLTENCTVPLHVAAAEVMSHSAHLCQSLPWCFPCGSYQRDGLTF